MKIDINNINPLEMGRPGTLNERKIYQYVHPNNCESCQLQMGLTMLRQEAFGTQCLPIRMSAEWKYIYTLIWNLKRAYSTSWATR